MNNFPKAFCPKCAENIDKVTFGVRRWRAGAGRDYVHIIMKQGPHTTHPAATTYCSTNHNATVSSESEPSTHLVRVTDMGLARNGSIRRLLNSAHT